MASEREWESHFLIEGDVMFSGEMFRMLFKDFADFDIPVEYWSVEKLHFLFRDLRGNGEMIRMLFEVFAVE